jgi:hypothetical protein
MEQLDPVEKKICLACGIIKKLKSFGKTPSGNRGNVCNTCKAYGRTIKKMEEVKVVKKTNSPLMMFSVKKEDYIIMYNFFKSIGYSLETDIHTQFCEKHNLKPKIRKEPFPNHYSPKDCGLI